MQFLKNIRNSRGFTLIELLVVITIIGILATGGTVTYTSQIQKARDTTRISDLKALQSGLEQFYQDKAQYPDSSGTAGEFSFIGAATYGSGVIAYVPKLPRDPKSGQSCNKGSLTNAPTCVYMYAVTTDNNGIDGGEYKISSAMENAGNVTEKAAKDTGSPQETNRLEMGLDLADSAGGTTKTTVCDVTANIATAKGLNGVAVAGAGMCVAALTNSLYIAGNQ